jgi:hypothetical protein
MAKHLYQLYTAQALVFPVKFMNNNRVFSLGMGGGGGTILKKRDD